MKAAIIGTGKTGSKVVELLKDYDPGIFNTSCPPTLEKLKKYDVIITFVPGNAFLELSDLLIKSNLPVVSGATGFNWPATFSQKLQCKKLRWVHANNFALGMNLIRAMIDNLKNASKLFDSYNYTLHEIHHTQKKDSPSGTSKMWESWLGETVSIQSDRIGDAVGTHSLTLHTEFELITIKHEALDRKIFAQGAIWAAHELLTNHHLEYGLIDFTKLVKQTFDRKDK